MSVVGDILWAATPKLTLGTVSRLMSSFEDQNTDAKTVALAFLKEFALPLVMILLPLVISIVSFFVFPCCSCVRCGNAGRCCKYKAPPKHVWPKITCIVFLTLGSIFALGGSALGIWGTFDMFEYSALRGIQSLSKPTKALTNVTGSVAEAGDIVINALLKTTGGYLSPISSFWDADTRADFPDKLGAAVADGTLTSPLLTPVGSLVSNTVKLAASALSLPEDECTDGCAFLNYTAGFGASQDRTAEQLASLLRAGYDAAMALNVGEPEMAYATLDNVRAELEPLQTFLSYMQTALSYDTYLKYVRDYASYLLTDAGAQKLANGQPLTKDDVALSEGILDFLTGAVERLLTANGIPLSVSRLFSTPVTSVLDIGATIGEGLVQEEAIRDLLRPFSDYVSDEIVTQVIDALNVAKTYLEPFAPYMRNCASAADEEEAIACLGTVVNGALGLDVVKDFLGETTIQEYAETLVTKYGPLIDVFQMASAALGDLSFDSIYDLVMKRTEYGTNLHKLLWKVMAYLPCGVSDLLFGPKESCPMVDESYEPSCPPRSDFSWDLSTPGGPGGEPPANTYVGLNLEKLVYRSLPGLQSASFFLDSGDVVLPLALSVVFFLMPILIVSILLCSFCCRCTCCATFSLCFTCYSPFVIALYAAVFLAVSLVTYNYACNDIITPTLTTPTKMADESLRYYFSFCEALETANLTSCPDAPFTLDIGMEMDGIITTQPETITFDLTPVKLRSLNDLLQPLSFDLKIDFEALAQKFLGSYIGEGAKSFNFPTLTLPIEGTAVSIDNLFAYKEPEKDLFATLGISDFFDSVRGLVESLISPLRDPKSVLYQILYTYVGPYHATLMDTVKPALEKVKGLSGYVDSLDSFLADMKEIDLTMVDDFWSTETLPEDFASHILVDGNFGAVYDLTPALDYFEVFYARLALEALALAASATEAGTQPVADGIRAAIATMEGGNRTYEAREALYNAFGQITTFPLSFACLDNLWGLTSETDDMGECEAAVHTRALELDPSCNTGITECVRKYKAFFTDISSTALSGDTTEVAPSIYVSLAASYFINFFRPVLDAMDTIIDEAGALVTTFRANPTAIDSYVTGILANVEYVMAVPSDMGYTFADPAGMLMRAQPSYPLIDYVNTNLFAPGTTSVFDGLINKQVWAPVMDLVGELASSGVASPYFLSSLVQTPQALACDGFFTMPNSLAGGFFFTFIGLYTVLIGAYCIHPYIYQAWMSKKGRLYPSDSDSGHYDDDGAPARKKKAKKSSRARAPREEDSYGPDEPGGGYNVASPSVAYSPDGREEGYYQHGGAGGYPPQEDTYGAPDAYPGAYSTLQSGSGPDGYSYGNPDASDAGSAGSRSHHHRHRHHHH